MNCRINSNVWPTSVAKLFTSNEMGCRHIQKKTHTYTNDMKTLTIFMLNTKSKQRVSISLGQPNNYNTKMRTFRRINPNNIVCKK